MQWHMYLHLPLGGGGGGGGELPIIALMMVAFSLAAGLVLRRRGIHLITPFADQDQSAPKAPLRKWQFGLGDLLLMTATACLTMGLIALIAPYPGWILELPVAWCKWLPFINPSFRVLMALEHVGLTFLAALATLPRPLLSRRLAWVALVAAVWPLAIVSAQMATLLCVIGFDPDILGFDPREFFLGNLRVCYGNSFREFGFLAASFLVVRLVGCRLVREEPDGSRGGSGSEARQVASESGPEE